MYDKTDDDGLHLNEASVDTSKSKGIVGRLESLQMKEPDYYAVQERQRKTIESIVLPLNRMSEIIQRMNAFESITNHHVLSTF